MTTAAILRAQQRVIQLARPQEPEATPFSVGRYPFTYAYDHLRMRGHGTTRHEASIVCRALAEDARLPYEFVATLLAEAYLAENNVRRPNVA